jgi:CRISPR-associated endonuclease/helicase Cas3
VLDARLWGKAKGLGVAYPLIGHLVDTAMVAGAVWDEVLTEGQRRKVADVLGVPAGPARQMVMFWAGLPRLVAGVGPISVHWSNGRRKMAQ